MNVNKLKAYRNPIITVVTITIIMQDENRILLNGIPRRIIGERTQIYERFKLNEQKGEAKHNKNYDGEIITSLPKKWIRDHEHQKCVTTTHHDMTIKPISRIGIPPHKPLWLQVLYLIHQEKNFLRNLQQRFRRHGKLLLKEKNYLND